MKVELRKVGKWVKRNKLVGEVVAAKLFDGDGNLLLEGDWGVDERGEVYIRSRSKNARLSNFSRIGKDGFEFDGVYVRGLEGFLQGVKFEDEELQRECCSLVGAKAWKFGRENDKDKWKEKQVVYWKGIEYSREGDEYAALLEEFFDSVYKGMEVNRDKLLLSGDLVLDHSGSSAHDRKSKTILAHDEFIGNLNRVRSELMRELNVEVVWLGDAPLVSDAPRPQPVAKKVVKKVVAPIAQPKWKEEVLKDAMEDRMAKAVSYVKEDMEDGIEMMESIEDACHEYQVDRDALRLALR